tara:strand:+ start:329 stop:562 length:234 start_codon:yes stop_codon:yes gene_type:complete
MPRVNAKNMSFEKALRIFRKKCDNAGIKDEVRKREWYEKPNQKRRRVKQEAIRRKDRAIAKEKAEFERRAREQRWFR